MSQDTKNTPDLVQSKPTGRPAKYADNDERKAARAKAARERRAREQRELRRVNVLVSDDRFLALARLANYYGLTKAEMLEKLINDADKEKLDDLNQDGRGRYFMNLN